MTKRLYQAFSLLVCLIFASNVDAQGLLQGSEIHGNTQVDGQLYLKDKNIGLDTIANGRSFGLNGYTDLTYTYKNFSAGARFEAYLPPISGFKEEYNGSGVPYKWAKYTIDELEITAGNFYEQFGSGLVLRTYQEWNLGLDNSLDGARVVVRPLQGVKLTGVYGTQRRYWVSYKDDKKRGIVKGVDGEIDVFQLLQKQSDLNVIVGGSFVSKYQNFPDNIYKIPYNVGAAAGRLNLTYKGWDLYSEYAWKSQDPNALNNLVYRNGQALYSTLSYAGNGLGMLLQFKRLDNFSFKSDRSATGEVLDMNYLPALTTQQSYALASFFPYATQPNGEIGFSAQLNYKFKRKSLLGGKYGTSISLEYAQVNDIEKTQLDSNTPIDKRGTDGYNSDFFAFGDMLYRTASLEINKKLSRKLSAIFTYLYVQDQISIVEDHPGEPKVEQHVMVLDVTHKLKNRKSIHWELQGAFVNNGEIDHPDRAFQGRRGNWIGGLLEYNMKNFFISAMDQWNYDNTVSDYQNHYYNFSAGYRKNTSRISLSYGRQREGILCIGGVCRQVPAASGFTLSITTSF
ncbi:MAG: DUF6029 family protein [Hyphomicrobiales bacterium]